MRKYIGILLAFALLFLVSCSPAPMSPLRQFSQLISPTSTGDPLSLLSTTCTLLHFPVTPEAALGAEFEGRSHVSGPADAPVTIIAFSDYQCLPCAFLAASLKTNPADPSE